MGRTALLLATIAALGAGCGGPSDRPGSGDATPLVVRDTVGDTVVVHTRSGSVWGAPARLVPEVSIGVLDGPVEYIFGQLASLAVGPDGTIYVVDGQGPDLRAFGQDGTYRATLARSGEGPGELNGPDGGMVVLPDGRVVVRDPDNTRFQVFGADGTAAGSWPWRGGLHTSRQMYRDRSGNLYSNILLNQGADVADWRPGLVRIAPDGRMSDTLRPPDAGYEVPVVEIRVESATARYGVPFAPREGWALHPSGGFLHWVATDYALTLAREDGFLRFGRDYEPVPVHPGEADEARARIRFNVRSMDPTWRWDGPPLPEEKAPFRTADVGVDGRTWVQISTEGVHREDPDHDPDDPMSVPNSWREPIAWDVFEEDGTYLGRVDAPEDLRLYPTPVFDGDRVWATTQDDLGVIRVVRYRVGRPDPDAP